jgi:hypothetical protein
MLLSRRLEDWLVGALQAILDVGKIVKQRH